MCWRVVKIEGDGSVKLILASSEGTCDEEGALTENSALLSSSTNLTTWYNTNLSDYDSKIKKDTIYLNDVYFDEEEGYAGIYGSFITVDIAYDWNLNKRQTITLNPGEKIIKSIGTQTSPYEISLN